MGRGGAKYHSVSRRVEMGGHTGRGIANGAADCKQQPEEELLHREELLVEPT